MKRHSAFLGAATAALLCAGTAQADLQANTAHVITLESLGFSNQNDAEFGYSLTAAGHSLVIGAPRRLVDGVRAGAVYQVISAEGEPLSAGSAREWHQGIPASGDADDDYAAVSGSPEEGDRFGHALAAGRPGNNSGYCEPAVAELCWKILVGVPGEGLDMSNKNTREFENAGMVNVLVQPVGEIPTDGTYRQLRSIHQGTKGIIGKTETGDRFGAALAVGDFNSDGGDDIAIGAPSEAVGDYLRAGGVNVIMGDVERDFDFRADGWTAFNNTAWSQQNLEGRRDENEYFGRALAAGDFNGDGATDLAVGIPNDYVRRGDNSRGGSVQIIFGQAFEQWTINEGGLTLQGNELISQNDKGVAGDTEAPDQFGAALAAGDFNNDGVDDLAIGAPGEAIGDTRGAGMIHVVYGSRGRFSDPNFGGLKTGGKVNEIGIHQNTKDVPGGAEAGDRFGAALAAGDVNGDGVDDLIVGIPGEDLVKNSVKNAGAVQIFYGSAKDGIVPANNRWFDQKNLNGRLTANMEFGHALVVGDFDQNGRADLAIGSNSYRPRSLVNREPIASPGTVTVVYQD